MRHLFLSELYFGFFQTFEDSMSLRRFGRNRNITRLEINNKCLIFDVLFLFIGSQLTQLNPFNNNAIYIF